MLTNQTTVTCEAPVFILTASRSGSTLLRFILDSHPEFACPPETGIGSVCAALTRVWSVLDHAGLGTGAHEPPSLPAHAAAAAREAIDALYAHYLRRRDRARWCDKSLDSFQFAGLITQVYPGAKFICLYRHCLDVIASGVEACPWGLHRFGFDPYVAQYPGNSVAAIGSYWLDVNRAIMDFEQQQPQACHRVRYEDLVFAPEQTAAAIFAFLDAAPAPGITERCFRTPHEGEGPGDEKIWFTHGIERASIGRGTSVPVTALPAEILESVNKTLIELDYRPADDRWNASPAGQDPRADTPPPAPVPAPAGTAAIRTAIIAKIAEQSGSLDEITRQWPAVAGVTVTLVIASHGGTSAEIPLTFSTQPATSGEPAATIIADSAAWHSLLTGRANLVTEMVTGRVRCVNKRDSYRLRTDELHAAAAVLGIATVPVSRADHLDRDGGADALLQ